MKRCKVWLGVCVVMMACAMNAAAENWALPRVSVACVRENPGHASELGTQVIMGTPLKVLGEEDGWVRVETPEHYHGYVIGNSLQMIGEMEMENWKDSDRWVVTSLDQTYVYSVPEATAVRRVSDVMNGTILLADKLVACAEEYVAVVLPDGRRGYVERGNVMPLYEWVNLPVDVADVLDMAVSLMGTPYLWGGTSSKSMDCSGLTKLCFLSQGVILPRNASEQAREGVEIDKTNIDLFWPGDLLFFGNVKTGRINHVGMYLADGRFVHCSGQVKINSLNRGEVDYADLGLISVKRLRDTDFARLKMQNHPWFF